MAGGPHSNRVRWFKYLFGFFVPFILLPLPLVGQSSEARCGYVILLMACYWVVEPIPMAATSLLPVVLFPLLGVLSTNEASREYMNGTSMMFVGGMFVAVAIDECNLDKRIALMMLRFVGTTPAWMMLGFMGTSMFMSMWISNAATAALMVPIVDAVMEEMGDKANSAESIQLKKICVIPVSPPVEYGDDSKDLDIPCLHNNQDKAYHSKMVEVLRKAFFLSVAYSTNIGGTGTITGTAANMVAKSVLERLFPESNGLTFDKWMMFNAPVMLLCIFIAWVYLYLFHVRRASKVYTREMKTNLNKTIEKKYQELGPLKFKEGAVLFMFVLLVFLWVFRDPYFLTGWGRYFPKRISDATPAIAIPLLLFLIPEEPLRMGRSKPLLEWRTIHQKVPWGIILLLGGGFTLATASEKSGLSRWVTQQLLSLNISSPLAAVTLLCALTAVFTEFTTNVVTANIILPVVAELAVAMKIHPLYLIMPVTISCAFAFMLPVATPPNAIVYEAGNMSTMDMVKPGAFMNCICVLVEILMISTYGRYVFDIDHFPEWAHSTAIS